MSFLMGAGEALLSFASSLVNNLIKWAAAIAFYKVGRAKQQAEAAEEIIEVLKEQRKILAQPELHRRDLLDRASKRVRQ